MVLQLKFFFKITFFIQFRITNLKHIERTIFSFYSALYLSLEVKNHSTKDYVLLCTIGIV